MADLVKPGSVVTVSYRDTGLYPKAFTGVVEKMYPKFAAVRVLSGYRTTVHVTDYGLVRKAGRAE
ncbi:hypothetical protein Desku_1594 [Desulfofundulus kuznetsovii DSM 6115]|uniref:Uncharacterized protein n=1 Tax=Desulfofundulus kuznetsovii (strain DSM 6115 / VKM B-1805 / 17) TaxID=760568 RepID=A0AAU8PVR4_DESK7|nr:hypothetical protein Desku_1594 [Desulfofundulus kuznetsovii DSM 6115]